MKLVTKIFKRDDWYITSKYGYREPITTNSGVTNNFHNGCDYGTYGQKWPQYAIDNGYILSCGIGNDGGKYIWVNYPRINKKLLHYHLDSICVEDGQSVEEGTLLGYTGETGMATGIHLHLGMMNSNSEDYQDPHVYNYQENNDILNGNNKTIDNIVEEVIVGKWGNGQERINLLTNAGYNAKEIQKKVNEILKNDNKFSENKYVVQKGDTLIKIAQKYGTTYQEIYKKNVEVIGENPDIIKPGQVLNI